MKKAQFNIYIFLLSYFLIGCQVFNYTKQQYVNTVSYFNTYYNTSKLFDDAEKEILAAQAASQEKGTFTIPSTAKTKLTSCIEKSSKLLSYYPTSELVDDALLLIGKSYVYLEDDAKAEKKFVELITQYPTSDLVIEAKLWYGRSLLHQKKYQEGIKVFNELYAQAVQEGEEEIAATAMYEVGEYYYSLPQYEEAIKSYTQALEVADDDVMKEKIHLRIAQSYEAKKEYAQARDAYEKTAEYNENYATTMYAKIQQAKMVSKLKNYEDALSQLSSLMEDEKNVEYFGRLRYEKANVTAEQGKTLEAIQQYQMIDSLHGKTDEAAKSLFQIGILFEKNVLQYDSAKIYYEKAKTEFPSSEITTSATKKAETFLKYFSLTKDIMKYDSLLMVKNVDTSKNISDTVKVVELKKDSVILDSTKNKITQSVQQKSIQQNVQQLQAPQETQKLLTKTQFELAGLFYLEIEQNDSALFWFNKVIATDSSGEFIPRSLYTIADIYQTIGKPKQSIDSLYKIIVKNYPESPYANESRKNIGLAPKEIKKDEAEECYYKAEKYLEEKNNESAKKTFSTIIEKFPQSPYSAKALYSMGWMYENVYFSKDTTSLDSAKVVYNTLVKQFPTSTYAIAVKSKLDEVENEKRKQEEELEAKSKTENEKRKQKEELKIKSESEIETPSDTTSTQKKKSKIIKDDI